MSEKDLGSTQVAAEASPQISNEPRPAQKRGFFKRFWWAIVLVLIAAVIIVVCLVIFVGVPKIAQKKIDQAKLEIQGVRMWKTRPDQFMIDINSTITTDGKIKGNIDAFTGVLYLTDAGDKVPFMNIAFPATTSDKHQTVNISQEINIADHDAFNRFNVWFFDNETLSITLQGRTKVKAHGLNLKFGVDFKKVVEMKGLNSFKGSTVSDGSILLKAVDGANFKANTQIPNPSYFSLEIGDTTFANSIDGTPIGNLTIKDLVVRPGINNYPVTADLDQSKVLNLVAGAKYCKGGDIPVVLSGTSAVNQGEHLVYYEKALASASQTVSMDIISIIKSSLNITITCMD